MRVAFLVDGFNVYHSAVKLRKDIGGASTKWLNLVGAFGSMTHLIGKSAALEKVYYFSALAHHMEAARPGTVARHEVYLQALKATGVVVSMGRFKAKYVRCNQCNTEFTKNEEKETDVAIAVKLLELLHRKECDAAMLVSGDTDLVPAIRCAKALYPNTPIGVVFPYRRKNAELVGVSDMHFKMKRARYLNNQFPDPVKVDGKEIHKPHTW